MVEYRKRLGCQSEIPLEEKTEAFAYVYVGKCLLLLTLCFPVFSGCFLTGIFQTPNEYIIYAVYYMCLSRVQFEKFNYNFSFFVADRNKTVFS